MFITIACLVTLSRFCWSPRTDSNMVHSISVCKLYIQCTYVLLGCPNTDCGSPVTQLGI